MEPPQHLRKKAMTRTYTSKTSARLIHAARSASFYGAILVGVSSAATTGYCQVAFQANTVSYAMNARSYSAAPDETIHARDIRHSFGPLAAPVSLEKTIEGNWGPASVLMTASGRADWGSLGVSLSGYASQGWSPGVPAGSMTASGTVTARWQDTVVVESPSASTADVFVVESFFELKGQMGGDVAGAHGTDRAAYAYIELDIRAQNESVNPLPSGPFGSHIFASFAVSTDPSVAQYNNQHSSLIPLVIWYPNGKAHTSDFAISLTAHVGAGKSLFTSNEPAGEMSATFIANYGQTLTWGGITRVTNATTGEVVDDWTISSASGFDYSRPFQEVPEPAALPLLVLAALGFKIGGRRRAA